MISSQVATHPSIGHPAQRLSRQRFSALAQTRVRAAPATASGFGG